MKMIREFLNGTKGQARRRGAALVLVAVMLFVLLGMASLTIDVGVLYIARADLQQAADAAAMAGASAYASEAMIRVRQGIDPEAAIAEVRDRGRAEVKRVANFNHSFGITRTAIEDQDIRFGWIDTYSGTSVLVPDADPDRYNAVEVITRRSEDSTNGPVELFFSSLFGKPRSNVAARAVAAYDDRFSGYIPEPSAPTVWPFTMKETEFERQFAEGSDDYTWDTDTYSVSRGADGVREILLYPDDLAPGSYGLLNIGLPNMGTPNLAQHVLHGVPISDFELETGSPVISFFENGEPNTYQITGNPGLKAALESTVEKRIGDLVAFFVHDEVMDGGSNSVYRITGMRWGIVMHANFGGNPTRRGLWIQPVAYNGPGIITDPDAPSSNGQAGVVLLVR